jgi:AbrB family looped-hinge helix DNA binding protein
MTTTVSSKGQVVIPLLARAKLRLVPGTKLSCEIQGDSIVLKPKSPRAPKTTIVVDEITGLRVTKRTIPEATVTSEMVKALLADFP